MKKELISLHDAFNLIILKFPIMTNVRAFLRFWTIWLTGACTSNPVGTQLNFVADHGGKQESMKRTITILVLISCLMPLAADGSEQDAPGWFVDLGLAALHVVPVEEASKVRGQGYVYAYGSAASSVDLDFFAEYDVFADATGDSYMELYLQGLSNLSGVVGTTTTITVDYSQVGDSGFVPDPHAPSEGGPAQTPSGVGFQGVFDYAGTITVTSRAFVSGSAN